MQMNRAFSLVALLLAVASAGSSAAVAQPSGSTDAFAGSVRLGAQAQWVSPVAINAEVDWQCSPGFVAVLRIEVMQQSSLVPTRGLAKRAVVCDGEAHNAAVTVHSLLGTFQLGDASAVATLTVLHGPPATFSHQRTIQIVAR